MKVLDLPLKSEWYLMIESGVKPEEYRKIKPYWSKRLVGHETPLFSHRYGYQQANVNMDDKHIAGSIEAALRANSEADRYNVSPAERKRIADELRKWYMSEHRNYKEPIRQLELFEDYG